MVIGTFSVSAIALITTWSSSTATRKKDMRGDIASLEAMLLSKEVRTARHVLAVSPSVIREARENYSPWSHDKKYLELDHVKEAIKRGAAKDSDHLADAYSQIFLCLSRAASAAPRWKKFGPLAAFWRRSSPAIYAELNEILSVADEARWELAKHGTLWPLDKNSFVQNGMTLLSDANLKRIVAILNVRRDQDLAPEITIPHPDIESNRK